MATLYYKSGKKDNLTPKNGINFTMEEICKILMGPVNISFYFDVFVFNKTTTKRYKRNLNSYLTESFGETMYGDIFVVKDFELPPQFFIPVEVRKSVEEYLIGKTIKDFGEGEQQSDSDLLDSVEKFDNFENSFGHYNEVYHKIFDTFYSDIVNSKDNWEDYIKDIQIKIGSDTIKVKFDFEQISSFVKKALNKFKTDEEYEKCSIMMTFKHFLEDFFADQKTFR